MPKRLNQKNKAGHQIEKMGKRPEQALNKERTLNAQQIHEKLPACISGQKNAFKTRVRYCLLFTHQIGIFKF